MQWPLVFAARRHRSNAGSLTLFDCVDKVVPLLDFCRIDSGFLAQFLIVPEDDWRNVVRQSVNLTIHGKVLDGGRVKGVLKPAFASCFRDVLANARTDLLVHHPAAPTVKSTGPVLGLEQGGQFGFESLVFQIVEFHFDTGVSAFEFLSGLLPNRYDFGIRLKVQDLNDRLSRSRRQKRCETRTREKKFEIHWFRGGEVFSQVNRRSFSKSQLGLIIRSTIQKMPGSGKNVFAKNDKN